MDNFKKGTMNIHIITSSYPASPDDPSGTAGLFIRQFALELAAAGHKVIVQPAAKKQEYRPDPGILIVPAPWKGGDQELASMNFASPRNWWIFLLYFIQGARNTLTINNKYAVDRTICMWAVPSGVFGLIGKLMDRVPYDVWALGSDIWKIRKIPIFGKMILRTIIKNADRVFADGIQLSKDVTGITGVPCEFLTSSRKIPSPQGKVLFREATDVKHFLFVGRYHVNKGPDLLIQAIACLPQEIRESIRVHMFGFGPLEEELRKMISDMQLEHYISLNGPIEAQEFSNHLESVSFLVIPSRIESIPVVFSDALQIGTPVIAMPVGDLKHLIHEFGCGIVADEVTPQALAEALAQAAKFNKGSFQAGVAKAFERFRIETSVKIWQETGSPVLSIH